MLFDTHCHLDDPRLHEELDDVLARARQWQAKIAATEGDAA